MNEELLPPKHLINYSKNTYVLELCNTCQVSLSILGPRFLPRSQVSVTESCAPVNAFAASLVNTAWPTSSSSGCLEPAPEGVAGEDGTQVPLSGYQNKYATYILFSWTTYQLERTNPFLLILNVPQIQKTGVHLQFQKISDWPMWLLIDPL